MIVIAGEMLKLHINGEVTHHSVSLVHFGEKGSVEAAATATHMCEDTIKFDCGIASDAIVRITCIAIHVGE